MKRIALGVLLFVAGSVLAAPAPFPKSPHPQAKRYAWIDLRPLDNMPAKATYIIELVFVSSKNEGERKVRFWFAILDGGIQVARSDTDENRKELKQLVVQSYSVDRSLSAAEGIRQVLIEEGVACGRGKVMEVNPCYKVKIQHKPMPEGCVPVISNEPR